MIMALVYKIDARAKKGALRPRKKVPRCPGAIGAGTYIISSMKGSTRVLLAAALALCAAPVRAQFRSVGAAGQAQAGRGFALGPNPAAASGQDFGLNPAGAGPAAVSLDIPAL